MPGLLILFFVALALLVVLLTMIIGWELRHPPRHTTGYAIAHGLPCDPGDLGLAFDSWWLEVEWAGARLPMWEVDGENVSTPERQNVKIVFLHGWGESRVDSLSRARPLMETADRFVFYDLRGHGDAEGRTTALGHDEHRDLLALIERETQPVTIIAYGLGAVIAMNAALHTKQIAGIIAVNPYDDFHTWLRSHLRAQRLPARPMTDLLMLWMRLIGKQPPDLRQFDAQPSCPVLILEEEPDAVTVREFIHRTIAAAAHHRDSLPASEAAAT